MTVKINIVDGGNNVRAKVHQPETGGEPGLVVYTELHREFRDVIGYFSNPTYGVNMAQNAVFSGTTIGVHNGIDNVYWTGSAIAGAWTFNSAAQARTGAQSVDGTDTLNGAIAQFAKGASQDLTSYAGISGWIYLDSFTDAGIKELNIYGYDTGTGLMVGNSVNIYDIIDRALLDTWQSFSVLFSDMGLTGETIDAFRVEVANSGVAPDFYLDDIWIEETGGPITFEYQVPPDNEANLEWIRMSIASSYDSDHTDASVPFIEYNDFLGLGVLTNGIVFRIIKDGETILSESFSTLGEFLEWPASYLKNIMSSGSTTFVSLESNFLNFTNLEGDFGDKLQLIVQDDLSSLQRLRTVAGLQIRDSVKIHKQTKTM